MMFIYRVRRKTWTLLFNRFLGNGVEFLVLLNALMHVHTPKNVISFNNGEITELHLTTYRFSSIQNVCTENLYIYNVKTMSTYCQWRHEWRKFLSNLRNTFLVKTKTKEFGQAIWTAAHTSEVRWTFVLVCQTKSLEQSPVFTARTHRHQNFQTQTKDLSFSAGLSLNLCSFIRFVLFLFYFSTRHVICWSISLCKRNSLWTMNYEL